MVGEMGCMGIRGEGSVSVGRETPLPAEDLSLEECLSLACFFTPQGKLGRAGVVVGLHLLSWASGKSLEAYPFMVV